MKRKVGFVLVCLLFLLTACSNDWNIEPSSQGQGMESLSQNTEIQNTETKPDKGEFTMEKLIEFCSDEKRVEEMEEEGIGYFLHYNNFELIQGDDTSTWEYKALLPYGDRTYEILVRHNWPHHFEQKFPEDNPVENIYVREKEFGDNISLYSRYDEEYNKPDIASFLAKEYHDITYYVNFELPDGITLGKHELYMNLYYSGSKFEGEKTFHNDHANDYFCEIGGIGVTEEEQINQVLVFENGKLVDAAHPSNHGGRYSQWEQIENEDMCAILADYEYDRFTGLEMQEYEEAFGVSLTDADRTCEYWYVFMGNEGEERSYHAFFHKNAFTKEEVIEFVKSIRLK